MVNVMAKRPKNEPPEALTADYTTRLMLRRDKDGLKKHSAYLREHNKELRRLEREARGEQVPGDYDGGHSDS